MPEIQTQSPVPQKTDDAAFLDDVAQAKEQTVAGETWEELHAARLKAMLPGVSATSLKAVLESLKNTGTLDSFIALIDSPAMREDVQSAFQMQIATAMQQKEDNEPLSIDPWIKDFISDFSKEAKENTKEEVYGSHDSGNIHTQSDKTQERLKGIQSFDAILKKHPEILGKLKAQGIDLDAEKIHECKKLKKANPGMPDEVASARSSITVYLRHEHAIHKAASDESVRKELDASFAHLKFYAREANIPYWETIRNAAGILPTDKAAIMAATTGTALDSTVSRAGNTLYVGTPWDHVTQVWTLRRGERPEKSVELANGPRIKIATAPEPDLALLWKRNQAIDKIAVITGWEGVRTPEGLHAARSLFPRHIEATITNTENAPNAWSAFVREYSMAGTDDRKAIADAMQKRVSGIADPELKKRTGEAFDDLITMHSLGDQSTELVQEIGKKYAGTISQEGVAAKSRAEKKRASFELAIQTVDEANQQEADALQGFQSDVARTEAIARDNLAYFENNGYLAFGAHFDAFLSSLNACQLSIYPQADGKIILPKEFSERDRAFLAHGLVKTVGAGARVEDYFKIPGYILKPSEKPGVTAIERIRSGLEESGVLKDGGLRQNIMESRFTNIRQDNDIR